jgi:protein-disulfide isomerase
MAIAPQHPAPSAPGRMMKTTTWEAVLVVPVSAHDHIRGPMNAPVTLVEYGDYECPFCGAAHGVVNAIQAQVPDDLRFVFRHFPLTTMHPHAMAAAESAEAAGAQGKFWPMHDTLYENQQQLEPEDLLAYARALDLDLESFSRDLVGHVYAPKVREHFMGGVRSGVNGTPTFFVNGIRHEGSWDYDNLMATIQAAAMTHAHR